MNLRPKTTSNLQLIDRKATVRNDSTAEDNIELPPIPGICKRVILLPL